MDNIARRAATKSRETGTSSACVIFNVYGPREAHKGVPASMIYHLSRQMKAGQRPRIFKHGEQKRDFVYVKDIVQGSSARSRRKRAASTISAPAWRAPSTNWSQILNDSLGTNFEPEYIENPHAHYQNYTQADLTNVAQATRLRAAISLETGVADYMKWLYPA